MSDTYYTPGGVPINVETGRPRVVVDGAAPEENALLTVPPVVPEAEQPGLVNNRVVNRLFGLNGEERYQTWPEKMLRSGLSLPHDVMTGEQPIVDPETGHTSARVIERAQDTAGLAMGGAIGGTGARAGEAVLGSGPVRQAAAAETKGPIWHSAVENALEQSSTGAAHGAQWLGTLRNARGVKPEEMEWLGLNDYLAQAQVEGRKVTRQELQDYVRDHSLELRDVEKWGRGYDPDTVWERASEEINREYPDLDPDSERFLVLADRRANDLEAGGPPTKYHDYQLLGGENYREHLITLPERRLSDGRKPDPYDPAQQGLGNYHSSHWDEPNILAHVRTNDRTMSVPFTAEESAALRAHEAASSQLEALRRQQGEVGKEISAAAKPLEAKRRADILAENKAGRLTNSETMRRLEEPVEHPELAPLQEKLAALRVEESNLCNSLPEKPEPRTLKSLHLEEVQSDWHQQGRDRGYKGEGKAAEKKIQELLAEARTLSPSDARYKEIYAELPRLSAKALDTQRVPDAPFKKSWPELAMKRMIRRAAEEGYDRISWTPGEAQAARYDLSKSLNQVVAARKPDGTFIVKGLLPNGGTPHTFGEKIPVEKLPDYVGKELAAKIAKQEGTDSKVYEGVDLKVGGEGLREFYDKMLPKMVEKIGREHGVRVQRGSIPTKGISKTVDDRYSVTGDRRIFDTLAEAQEAASQPVFYFDIPQTMRDVALRRGFPLFSGGKMFVPHTQEESE